MDKLIELLLLPEELKGYKKLVQLYLFLISMLLTYKLIEKLNLSYFKNSNQFLSFSFLFTTEAVTVIIYLILIYMFLKHGMKTVMFIVMYLIKIFTKLVLKLINKIFKTDYWPSSLYQILIKNDYIKLQNEEIVAGKDFADFKEFVEHYDTENTFKDAGYMTFISCSSTLFTMYQYNTKSISPVLNYILIPLTIYFTINYIIIAYISHNLEVLKDCVSYVETKNDTTDLLDYLF